MSDDVELLRRAAQTVRALAADARSPGPYSVKGQCLCDRWDEDVYRCESREHRAVAWQVRSAAPPGSSWISHQVVETNHEGDAGWLAMLSPQLAEPLAVALEYAAERISVYDEAYYDNGGGETLATVARALLGEDES